ncbi:CHAT domain-containing protein [Mycena rosella]|uniref:CHAT domain-containing protein n=1 Tax=Mycena rosella TaxID=1033263 RepID=A0AAD7D2S2_MYCRO|nr:CHAT domain-containing protein [Mycena rosella]
MNPEASWAASRRWASFANFHDPLNGPIAYLAGFRLLPDILWIGNGIDVRQDAIRRLKIGPTTASATRACIQLGHLTTAVEILEQGVATTFQQMLQLKTDVDELPSAQAVKFRTLSSELYAGTASNPTDVARQRKNQLEEIRKQPGFEYFLCPKPYSVLWESSQGGPVVILNSHRKGCDGIIILRDSPQPIHVPLPEITLDFLKSQKEMLAELLGQCNGFKSRPVQEWFVDLLKSLWTNIVEPVYLVLASYGISGGRLWWLPTGGFSGLPLHASPPSTDQFIHSYTATLGSLLDARNKESAVPKFGVVAVTHTGLGHENYLEGVGQEVHRIRSVVPDLKCLEAEKAIPEAVKLHLQDCSWLHLACHGAQDSTDPTKSRLLLYEGSLELGTILRMPLSNAEFVFLGACQTAMGDAELLNESFHFGGGFIAAGFRSAVGTLWSMDDRDGPSVAENFYTHLFRDGRRPRATDTAEALRSTVGELRANNTPYARWVPFIHMGV